MTDPCALECLRGHGDRCYARRVRNRGICAKVAEGHPEYIRLVDERAAKPRVALGTNQRRMAPPGCRTCGKKTTPID